MPRGAHGVTSQSETTARDTCGMRLWNEFLIRPTGALDTSCTAEVLAHDFSDGQVLATQMFGRSSLWGSPAGAAPISTIHAGSGERGAPSLRAEIEHAMRATTPWVPVHQRQAALTQAVAHRASR